MIYIEVNKIDDTRGVVGLVHYQPEVLPEEMLKRGFLVKTLPVPDPALVGKRAISYYYYETSEIKYEYVDIPETNKETIESLQKDNAQLLKENVKKDAVIESLSKDIADIYKMIGGNK